VIDRSKTRDTPKMPVVAQGRELVRDSGRGNHLGQRSCANATKGRTYERKRSDQILPKTSCEPGAVHIWCLDRHGFGQCLGVVVEARENPSRLAAMIDQAA
jgi:hypothetical protein